MINDVSKNLSAAGNWWRVLKLATKIGVLGCKQRYLLIRNRQLARQLDVLLREQRSLRLQHCMSALDTAKEIGRIGSTAGLSKDVIDL